MSQNSHLLNRILLFSRKLRENKIGVTVDNVADVVRGIRFIDLQRKNDFYYLLRFNFVSLREQMTLFDKFFEQFWGSDNEGVRFLAEEEETAGAPERDRSAEKKGGEFALTEWTDDSGGEQEGALRKEILAYSPEEILREKKFEHLEPEELGKVKEFVKVLSRKLARVLSRRWRTGKRGERIDLRRSIRHSIKYGGETVELQRKQQKLKPLRLVFSCDVSGSMDVYNRFVLLFLYGLQNAYPYCETFAFSTRLSRITPLLKRKSFEEALSLIAGNVLDWSGGTNIGGAIHQLHQYHSHLLNPGRTLFLIFSDGWDRGDSALLGWEMRRLKKQVKRLIWLNPLLGSRYYQPLCKGMSTALPYVDEFLPCHNFASLEKLTQLVLQM